MAVLAVSLSACGAAPSSPEGRHVYRDLRKIVDAQARRSWVIDRVEIAQNEGNALRTLCQTTPAMRQEVRAFIDAQIVASGGPTAPRFAKGEAVDDLREVMALERTRRLFAHAVSHIEADCPAWLRADPAFAGVQNDAHRFVLMLETMGGGQYFAGVEPAAFGGTGAARLLPGYGITERLTLAGGLEMGGASTFPRGDDGSRSVDASLTTGFPLLLRFQDRTLLVDTELTATLRSRDGSLDEPRPGLRISQGIGTSDVRLGSLMPYLVLWIGYEMLPAANGDEAAHILRAGTRLGFDWDPDSAP